jgi:ABC-type sugar transport system substrate-binding protein
MFNKVTSCLILAILFLPGYADAGNEEKVALVMKALTNPFFSKMEAGAKEYARANNLKLEVFGVERETDIERQIGIVENLIQRGYGAIVIAPADSKRLVPICKKAMDRGMVVINIDNPLHKLSLARYGISIPFVGSDNSQGADMVGEYIKRKLGGKGRVIIIEGIQGVENADLRRKGFIRGVTRGSQIKVVASQSANWHTDEAFALVTKLLKRYSSVDAFFCANDKMALGALRALEMAELTDKIWLGGYDNIEAARNEMRNGRLHATIEQHPELMGSLGVELAAKALSGDEAPKYVSTPLDLITYEAFDKEVVLCLSDLKNPFFSSLHLGAQKASELFGTRLILVNALNDDARQLADIQRFVEKGVDIILVNPTNTEAVSLGVELANTVEIPIITVDRKSAGGEVVCHIASDNIAGGRMAGEFLVKRLDGHGRILEIEGIPGTSAAHERGMGFNEVLGRYPEMKLVTREAAYFDREKARTSMERLLRNGSEFDAVFAHNDNMILGVLDALESAGTARPKVLIGFDAIDEAVEAVRLGKLTATIAQKPEEMGRLAIESAVKYFRGEKLPKSILVELRMITK